MLMQYISALIQRGRMVGGWFVSLVGSLSLKKRIGILIILLPMVGTIGYLVVVDGHSGEPRESSLVLSAVNQPSVQQASASAEVEAKAEAIWVDVSGAVVAPGVKELVVGDRITQALAAAGGLTDQADGEYVSQVLNLAQLLDDGDKLYIPTKAQVLASMPTPIPLLTKIDTPVRLLTKAGDGSSVTIPTATPSPTAGPTVQDNAPGASLVNVNTASESELDSLPGVGPATVTKIVSGRPYANIEQLCQVINNSKTCAEIEPLVGF